MNIEEISLNVAAALSEDLGSKGPKDGDITAKLIPATNRVHAQVITREHCVLAGKAWVDETFRQVDPDVEIEWFAEDGQKIAANQKLFTLSGNARSVLTAERTALNFLQTLSATATVTANYVQKLQGTNIKLLDTRKTLPGLRYAQKYAVTCGGGVNHRIGLFDAFLIKENHIMASGSIASAIKAANQMEPGKLVEVEVESLDELEQALSANADIVMLDNFSIDELYRAVKINAGKSKLEVSGNITQENLTQLRETGIDYISSGALTKNLQAIDLSMRILNMLE